MKKIILFTLMLLCIAQINLSAQEDEVFRVVEDMPMFPGCEDIVDKKETKDCAQQKMLEYIYSNIRYPTEALAKRVEGTAVVQFLVTKEGRIEDAKVVRDPGTGLGDAALAVVNKMNTLEKAWIPGHQRGKKVKVLFTLPVKFKIAGVIKSSKKK